MDNPNQKNYVVLGLLIAGGLFLFKDDLGIKLPSLGGGVSINEKFPDKPNGKALSAVEPVQHILSKADTADKVALARLWREMALVIGADNSLIQSTADIARANGTAGKLMDLRLKGKYSGLPEAVNKAIKDIVGEQAKSLDAAARQDAVDVYNALSWAAIGKQSFSDSMSNAVRNQIKSELEKRQPEIQGAFQSGVISYGHEEFL